MTITTVKGATQIEPVNHVNVHVPLLKCKFSPI